MPVDRPAANQQLGGREAFVAAGFRVVDADDGSIALGSRTVADLELAVDLRPGTARKALGHRLQAFRHFGFGEGKNRQVVPSQVLGMFSLTGLQKTWVERRR